MLSRSTTLFHTYPSIFADLVLLLVNQGWSSSINSTQPIILNFCIFLQVDMVHSQLLTANVPLHLTPPSKFPLEETSAAVLSSVTFVPLCGVFDSVNMPCCDSLFMVKFKQPITSAMHVFRRQVGQFKMHQVASFRCIKRWQNLTFSLFAVNEHSARQQQLHKVQKNDGLHSPENYLRRNALKNLDAWLEYIHK